mmetsp:Transcript_1189/g.4878  ORF Transcript_1189/g.4878 Transcript_1189/m.4878 type:complete len:285 (-) Transcript_1189:1789-2643(-)
MPGVGNPQDCARGPRRPGRLRGFRGASGLLSHPESPEQQHGPGRALPRAPDARGHRRMRRNARTNHDIPDGLQTYGQGRHRRGRRTRQGAPFREVLRAGIQANLGRIRLSRRAHLPGVPRALPRGLPHAHAVRAHVPARRLQRATRLRLQLEHRRRRRRRRRAARKPFRRLQTPRRGARLRDAPPARAPRPRGARVAPRAGRGGPEPPRRLEQRARRFLLARRVGLPRRRGTRAVRIVRRRRDRGERGREPRAMLRRARAGERRAGKVQAPRQRALRGEDGDGG